MPLQIGIELAHFELVLNGAHELLLIHAIVL